MKNSESIKSDPFYKTKRIIEILYRAMGGLLVSGIFTVLGWGIVCGYIR